MPIAPNGFTIFLAAEHPEQRNTDTSIPEYFPIRRSAQKNIRWKNIFIPLCYVARLACCRSPIHHYSRVDSSSKMG